MSSNLLPLGSLVYVMFCTRKHGWGWDNFLAEANAGEGLSFPTHIRFYMAYAIPAISVFIYLKGYYDLFSPLGLRYLIPWMIIAIAFLVLIFWITSQRKSGTHEG